MEGTGDPNWGREGKAGVGRGCPAARQFDLEDLEVCPWTWHPGTILSH